MDDSWTPFDDDADDRDRDPDPRDRTPFDAVFDLLSDRFDVDDDDFDGSFHFEVHTGTGPGEAGPRDAADPRRGAGMGPGAGSRRGHPRFGGTPPGRDPERVGRAVAGADAAGGTDDDEIDYEYRRGDDATEVFADLTGSGAVGADVSASVVEGDLVVATDGTTLFDAPLPTAGEVREVVERNGVLRVTVDHE
jgi:hypothetical protein